VLGRARRSWRGATGGADHIRSSLSVVLTDAAPVSTAAQWPQVDHGSIPRRLLGMGRAGRVLHQMIKNQVSDPIARRGVRLQPATLLFALIVVRSSTNAITLPLRVDGLRLEVGGRVNPDALRLHTDLAVTPARAQIALKWCREFVPSISSSAHGQEEVGAGWLAPDGQDDLAP
jgi:hypothetical protein